MSDNKEQKSLSTTSVSTAWDALQAARSPERPRASAYLHSFSQFDELHGDRMFGDCQAVLGGTAFFDDFSIMLLGQEKGHDLESRLKHNFGMPMPEGYRKAARLYRLAERYRMPVVIFLDSPGAYAGVDAEKRNQSEAIASSILEMTSLTVPIVVFVIGEAMSGGAMAMGVSDCTVMLSNSVYSVISPEGCSGILWKDKLHVQDAAEAMEITAPKLLKNGFIDKIITEPESGIQGDFDSVISDVHTTLREILAKLSVLSVDELLKRREMRLMQLSEIP